MDDFAPVDFDAPGFGALYDELPLWSAPFGLRMLEQVRLGPELTLLDVGSGTGFLALELAQRCGPRSTVHAVDPWAAAAERLRWKLAQLGLANVLVHECDACALPLPDASVDVVVSNLGLHNFADPDAVLRECMRVARPDATFHVTTNLAGHMQEFYDVYRATLGELGHVAAVATLDEHVAHRGTVASISALLASGGLQVGPVIEESFRMRFANGSALLRHWFIRMGFLPAWTALVPPGEAPATLARLEANLNAAAAARGELALTIPMAYLEARKHG